MKSIILSGIFISTCIVLSNYNNLQNKFGKQIISCRDQSMARKASNPSFIKHLTKTAKIARMPGEKNTVTWQSVKAPERVTIHNDIRPLQSVIPGLTRNPVFFWIPASAGMTYSYVINDAVYNSSIALVKGSNMVELNLEKKKENLFLCTLCASLLF